MNFSDRPPSEQWAALKYAGEPFAEVWFKPDGEPFALTFRIPQSSFQIPGMDQLLTTENLLKAVSITTEQIESWRREGGSDSDEKGIPFRTGVPSRRPARRYPPGSLCQHEAAPAGRRRGGGEP